MLRNALINTKTLLLLVSATFVFASCLKDPVSPTPDNDPARARIEITDAPIDDANVKGVFVTVVDVKIDGKSWAGFDGKTTFDLLAYQQGQSKLLGEGELDAKTYSEIVLVLDTETDANGDAPGCYVKDAQGNKKKLNGGSEMDIKVKGSFETKTAQTTEAIIDLDLRKAIVYQTGSSTDFQFVTDPELQTSIRVVDKAQTGTITGDCTDGVSGSDKVVVYAYKKGDFDATTEKFPQGASQIQFKNAITSSVVASDGAFNLSFLENGAYELHFIAYKADTAGKLQAKGELQLNLIGSTLNLLGLNVTANNNIDMDLVVTGILFF
jgi:Domain of unknown function (DUF4382)